MKPKSKPKSFNQAKNVPKTRKEMRKEKRKIKKQKRSEYYTNRSKPGKFVLRQQNDENTEQVKPQMKNKQKELKQVKVKEVDRMKEIQNEKKQQEKLQKQMHKQRNKQLLEANLEEDRNIRQLEKQLKLNKRKSKSIPKSFVSEGLDYVLEVCDERNMESVVAAEKEFNDVNDDFDEDFALMTGKSLTTGKNEKELDSDEQSEQSFDGDDNDDYSDESDDDMDDGLDDILDGDDSEGEEIVRKNSKKTKEKSSKTVEITKEFDKKRKKVPAKDKNKKKVKFSDEITNEKLVQTNEEEEFSDDDEFGNDDGDVSDYSDNEDTNEKNGDFDGIENEEENSIQDGSEETTQDGTWEDIYGRKRTKDGSVVSNTEGKYIPPAMRAKLDDGFADSAERKQKKARLKRQLKGLLNRLAEANLHNISNQIEDLYMKNSRNDMNDTIIGLMLESLASNVVTPERLLLEHVVLITILHANIGTEIGAHFLQTITKKFDSDFNSYTEVEDKTLDNVVHIMAQLYNFKLFHSKLLYDILKKLADKFDEKSVECILLILKSVGFSLRKDDPLALKSLILDLQKRASNSTEISTENARVKFMLDVLLAIKNNNVTKIPNYDTSYAEHLKKIMKSFVRKGNYVTQLNISLEDLLRADTRGKWWIVGSAWSGNIENQTMKETTVKSNDFSQKLLDLARKHRMSTDTRRNIFCIIMSAEDYMDAFEKLLRLGLKNQQEREIIHVLLHCCLQEKTYNPYYAVLAQKFCDHDRKFQMTIKFSVWDKLKALTECSASQLSNLAKMLTHLFLEKGLPISTLKIVQFSELDKFTLRFIRQILLGILSCDNTEACLCVFEKVAQSEKLKMFRESLRLFIHHFLLKNLKPDAEDQGKLQQRAESIDKMLMDKKIRF